MILGYRAGLAMAIVSEGGKTIKRDDLTEGFARPKGYPRKIEESSLPAPWIPWA